MHPIRMLLLGLWLLYAQVAGADLAVIVNPASRVERLSRHQVIDIFLGRYRRLPSGLAAMPIDLRTDAPEREQFYLLLVKKSLPEMNSYWARLVFSGDSTPPFQVADARTALDLVAGNPNAIAYIDSAAVDGRVKVVLELKH